MKGRTLAGLAVAAVAAVGAAGYFAVVDRGLSAPDPVAGQQLYPGLANRLNDVASITLTRKDGTLTLARRGQSWGLAEKGNYTVQFDRVRKLLVDLSDMRTVEAKTSSQAVYPSLEVEDISAPDAKSVLLTVKDSAGTTLAGLIVGKVRPGRSGPTSDRIYVRKAGEAQSWMVSGRLTVDREPERWVDRRIIDIGRDRVREATIVQADGSKLTVRRDKPADTDFTLVDPPPERTQKAAYERNLVGGALEVLELDDVRPASEVKFAAEGPYAELRTFDGIHVRTDLAEQDGRTWIRLAARFEAPAESPAPDTVGSAKLKSPEDAAKDANEITARVNGWAYRLPDYKLDYLRRKLEDMLEPAAKTQ
jgi:hypothetical protein